MSGPRNLPLVARATTERNRMGLSRNDNVDNSKTGPGMSKADASTPAQWRYPMGEWDAPGQRVVADPDSSVTQDDVIEHNYPGPTNDDPVSKPVGRPRPGQ